MEIPPRVTQKQVALAAKVNRTTVSLALSGHPSISTETRERIKEIAERIGYRPDPMLSALAVYRHARQPAEFHGTIGWLARTTKAHRWRQVSSFAAYFEAAKRQADRRGYRVDVIDLSELGSWKRAASLMRARGIRGVLLCPQPSPDTNLEELPWNEFSAVTFGYSVSKPAFNAVAPSQFRAAFRATSEMLALGYRRIGFCFPRAHDQRTDHNYFGGYLAARELNPDAKHLPPLFYEDDVVVGRWLKKNKPDAVLIGSPKSVSLLQESGLAELGHVGLASACLASLHGPLAGVCEANQQLGEAALDLLVAMMNRGERGVPEMPHRLLVDGVWIPGQTLKRVGEATVR